MNRTASTLLVALILSLAPTPAFAEEPCPPDAAAAVCGTHQDEAEESDAVTLPGGTGVSCFSVGQEAECIAFDLEPITVKDASGFPMTTDVESLGGSESVFIEGVVPATVPTVITFDAGTDPVTGGQLIGTTGGMGTPVRLL